MKAFSKDSKAILIWLFTACLIIIVPLIYSNKTVDINLVPQFLFCSILLALSIFLFFVFGIQKTYSVYFHPIFIALTGYFLFSCISLTGAINKPEGIFDLLKTGSWIVLIIVLTQLLKSNNETKSILFKAFTISSFVLALIGAAQLTGVAFTKLPGQSIPYGTLGNRNIFIPSLVLTLPFAIYQTIVLQNGKWKWFACISALLDVIVVIISGMRTTWIALSVSLVSIIILIVLFNKKYSFGFSALQTRALKILIFVFIIAGIGGGIVLYEHSKERKTCAGSVLSTSSTSERIVLWKKSFQMFNDHPLRGVGVGNWRIMLPDYSLSGLPREAQAGEMHYQRPENDFIWILAETGSAGFLCYFSIFVFAFYYLFKRLIHSKTANEKYFWLLLFTALIMYCVIAFWGFPKERTFLSIEFAVILSLILSEYKNENTGSKNITIHPAFFILFIGFCVYHGNKLYAGEVQTQKLIDARANNQNELVLKYADKAIAVDYLIDPTSTPINFYKGVAYFNKNNIDSALSNFELARAVHPFHLHVLNNLATCYETKENHTKATECLVEAIRISPDFQDAMINLTAIYYNTGRMNKAKEMISKCRSNIKNEELNTLNKLIDKKLNDSIIKFSADYFNSGNMQKAKAIIDTYKSKIKNPKVKEIKEAIINYKKDSIIKNAEKYFNEDSIKAAKLTLLKCRGCNNVPQYKKIRAEVDKRIGVMPKRK